MNSKAGKVIVALCVLGALGFLLVYALKPGGAGVASFQDPATAPDGIRDIGAFKVGYERGLDRTSFTGRTMVQVFVPEDNLQVFESLVDLLNDPAVTETMANFTGVIVPVPPEEVLSEEEKRLRALAEEEKIRQAIEAGISLPAEKKIPRFPSDQLPTIVIQSTSGPFLAVLQNEKLNAAVLIEELQKAHEAYPTVKSPILERSETDLLVIDRLASQGDFETLRKANDTLLETEPGSQVQLRVEAILKANGR